MRAALTIASPRACSVHPTALRNRGSSPKFCSQGDHRLQVIEGNKAGKRLENSIRFSSTHAPCPCCKEFLFPPHIYSWKPLNLNTNQHSEPNRKIKNKTKQKHTKKKNQTKNLLILIEGKFWSIFLPQKYFLPFSSSFQFIQNPLHILCSPESFNKINKKHSHHLFPLQKRHSQVILVLE